MDIIRCSVTFRDISDFLDGYNYLLKHIEKEGKGRLKIARIKNGFNRLKNGNDTNDGGYRDLKVNVIFVSSKRNKLTMIGEIQFLLNPFLKAKKKSHKLYSILRKQVFYKLVTQDTADNLMTKRAHLAHATEKFEINQKEVIYNAIVSEEIDSLAVVIDDLDEYGLLGLTIEMCKLSKAIQNKGKNVLSSRSVGRKVGVSVDDTIAFYKHNGQVLLLHTKDKTKNIYGIRKKADIDDAEIKEILTAEKSKNGRFFSGIQSFVVDKKDRILIHARSSKYPLGVWNAQVDEYLPVTDWIQLRSMKQVDKIVCDFDLGEKIDSIAPSFDESDNKLACAVSGFENKFWLLDLLSGKCTRFECKSMQQTQSSVFIGNKYLAIGGTGDNKQGFIEIWDKTDRKLHRVLKGFESGVGVLKSVGSSMYACSFKGDLIVCNVNNDFEQQKLNVKLYNIPKVHISENGKYLTVAGNGCKVFDIS